MIHICAWCQQEDQENIHVQMTEDSGELISHGICRDHARPFARRDSSHGASPKPNHLSSSPTGRYQPFLILSTLLHGVARTC